MNVFRNLKFKYKLMSLIGVLIIPIVVLIFMLITEKNIAIEFARKEIKGVEYSQAVRGLLQQVMEHRGMTNAYLNGDTSFKSKLGRSARGSRSGSRPSRRSIVATEKSWKPGRSGNLSRLLGILFWARSIPWWPHRAFSGIPRWSRNCSI